MTNNELQEAIAMTKEQIYQLKQQIEETPDPQEKCRLKRQLKELQYQQLWNLDQLG